MSLQVWLPLNGDLHNLGLSPAEATLSGSPSINTSGKIGSCYSFDGVDDCITLSGFNPKSWSQFSLTCWCYFPTSISSLFLIRGSRAHRLRVHSDGFSFRDTHNSTLRTISWGITLPTATWIHVACIYDKGKVYNYINGICTNSSTTYYNSTSVLYDDLNEIRIARQQTTSSSSYYTGRINDFRIYDHALSAKEVEEISKGLVLHYKLNDRYVESTTNLYNGIFSNTCYNGATNKYGYGTTTDIYKTTGTFQGKESVKIYMGTAGLSAYPYIYFDAFNTTGTAVHTLSFDYYPTLLTSIIPYSYSGSYNISYTTSNGAHDSKTNVSYITIPVITNQWNHISITMLKYDTTNTSRGNGYIRIGSASHTSTTSNYWLFANIQIEAKDHETGYTAPGTTYSNVQILDNSGYNNNGTPNNITLITDTARYNSAYLFNGSNSYIKINSNSIMPLGAREMTINLWVKNSAWATKIHFFSCTESGGFNTEAGNSGYLRFPVHVYTNSGLTSTAYKFDSQELLLSAIPTNEWVMLTWVYNSTGTRTYINGQLHHTYTNTSYGIHFNRNARLFLGCEASTANPTIPYYNGLMSDFRLYYTALTDNQIKELYNTSMTIDNLGNAYVRELVE